jgi:hypothetical protein
MMRPFDRVAIILRAATRVSFLGYLKQITLLVWEARDTAGKFTLIYVKRDGGKFTVN